MRATRVCSRCMPRLWAEPLTRPDLAVVRGGTLDDTSWLNPVAHIWTRSAQPWFAFPEGVARFEKQPEPHQLTALWRRLTDS